MISTMPCNFDSVCRLCMKADADLQPIFVESRNLCSKIREISSKLQIFEGDGLPAQICEKCIQQVISYSNFKVQCEESDAVFRHYPRSDLNGQNMSSKSNSADITDVVDELLILKEETATYTSEEVKQEPVANNNQDYSGEKMEEESQQLREVILPESREFENEVLGIKNDLIAFLSEDLNSELDASNEKESGDFSVGGENEDLVEELYYISDLERTKGNEYKCDTCSEVFISKESQEQHKCSTPYRCLICTNVLTNEADLCTHMLKHKNEPCRLCGKKFIDKTYYLRHLRAHSGLGHRCSYCDKLFPSEATLNIHVRVHTGEKPYSCEICSEKFARIQSYKYHLRKHTGERPFQCPTCLKTFLSNNTLKNHIRIHTGEKLYICEVCGNNFGDQGRFWHHIKKAHSPKEKNFKCPLCPKEYISNSELKAHMRNHTGERPYQCPFCVKAFALKTCLTGHIRIHTGEKKYGCTVCEKSFSSSSARNRHVRTHTGEAPFVCATCNKAFSLRKDLINHVFKFQH